jgi:hypothetical protein
MCNHKWVDTGMTATWCEICGVKADWVMGEVVLRPPSKEFSHSLSRFGLPIRYNSYRVGSSWGVPFIECFDAWVEKNTGSLSAGAYESLRIEQAYSDPTLVLVGEHNGTKGWERVPCSDVEGLVRFIESLLPANTPA